MSAISSTPSRIDLASGVVASAPMSRSTRHRALLILSFVAAPALAGTLASSPAAVEPDLARLLRFMALLKGVFAVVAFSASYWRLARPATGWREAVYVLGPAAMSGGALCLWTLQSAGLAALALHLGLFAVLAAALTDAGFIPPLRRPVRTSGRRPCGAVDCGPA